MRHSTVLAAVVVVSSSLAPGCKTTGGTLATVVAVAAVPVAASVWVNDCWPPEDGHECHFGDSGVGVGATIVGVAAVLAAVAFETQTPARDGRVALDPGPSADRRVVPVAGPWTHADAPPVVQIEHIQVVPLHEAIPARDPVAARLTLQSHRAAMRGDCSSIGVVGRRVRELDPAYHEQVFVVDPAIAGCL